MCVVTTFSLSSASSAPSFSCLLFLLMWRGALTGTTGPQRTRPHQQGQRRRTKGGGGEKVAPLLSSAQLSSVQLLGAQRKKKKMKKNSFFSLFPFFVCFVVLVPAHISVSVSSRLDLVLLLCSLSTGNSKTTTTNNQRLEIKDERGSTSFLASLYYNNKEIK